MSLRSVQTLILILDNEFGVLTRVTALVRREGWNIKSLAVAETINPALSRLTLSVECIDSTLPRVTQRLAKLACVRSIAVYSPDTYISRELVIVTMGREYREPAMNVAEAAGARVIPGQERGGLAVEYIGEPEKADSLIAALKPFGIAGVARSGIVALERKAEEEGL